MGGRLSPRGVAWAVALALILSSAALAAPSVEVEGLPSFLSGSAKRSLEVIVEQLPQAFWRGFSRRSEEFLQEIASQVFWGYAVEVEFDPKAQLLRFRFSPSSPSTWRVEVVPPGVDERLLRIMSSDLALLRDDVELLLAGIPAESLEWADRRIQEEVDSLTKGRLPGFSGRASVLLRGKSKTFVVELEPFGDRIASVNLGVFSSSLPMLLMRNIRDILLREVSFLVGLPLAWAEAHKAELEREIGQGVSAIRDLRDLRARAEISLRPSMVADVRMRVESTRYRFLLWGAVFVGGERVEPEAGLRVGRFLDLGRDLPGEIYFEAKTSVHSLSLSPRLGLSLSPLPPLSVGLERDLKKGLDFLTFGCDLGDGFNLWMRKRLGGEGLEGGLGRWLNENVMLEVYFKGGDGDEMCLRAVGKL